MSQPPNRLEPSMDHAALRAQIESDEGKRLRVYEDTLGYLTVGIGHRILSTDQLLRGQRITDAMCQRFFEQDLLTAIRGCEARIPEFAALPGTAREVLINMAFNLGIAGLVKFTRTLAAMRDGEWEVAAQHMLDSLWSKQVGNRATRLADKIRLLGA